MANHKIAVIPGDGIGKEVVQEGLKVLSAVEQVVDNVSFSPEILPWNCEFYAKEGRMMPEDGLKQLAQYDAIYLGAIGDPQRVQDHIALRQSLFAIRVGFDQYVNLRPIKLLEGVPCPIKGKGTDDIDFVVVRENTEGFYAGLGGRYKRGSIEHAEYAKIKPVFAESEEIVTQIGLFSQVGVERIMRYAFNLAQKRRKHVTCCTKSNALNYGMVYWDEMCRRVAADFPDVTVEFCHVDALTMALITRPHTLDVIVASNLFGDIITDLGSVIQGGIGLAAAANINPNGISMFEPVHGSAPDIAGKGIANPIAAIWTAQMMLVELKEYEAAEKVMSAIKRVLAEGKVRSKDLGGNATTTEVGDAVVDAILS